jgi:hypothetical protein
MPITRDFDGSTYDRKRDHPRLSSLLSCVQEIMSDGMWRSLDEIQNTLKIRFDKNSSEASVSARLRDLRKEKFGSHNIERRYDEDGLWEYRMKE